MSHLHEHYMAQALALARQAAAAGEVPVGAVVVHEGRIVGRGYNQPVRGCDPTAHAEIIALREAARALGNYRLPGCTLYVTLEPCAMCAQAALHARLERVVYGAAEPRMGAAGSVLDVLGHPALNAHTVVQGGVCAEEAAQLLRAFFAERRIQQRASAQPLRDDALRTPAQRFAPVWAAAQRWGVHEAEHSRVWRDLPALQGLLLHTLAVGPASVSPPWLCLHGPLGWWPQWLPWVEAALAQGERVLVPDLIGFGQSDKPKKAAWHTPERHAEVLRQWLDALGVGPCRLMWVQGMEPLAHAVQQALGTRVVRALPAPPQACLTLPAKWVAAPFPDQGHRAGPRAVQAWGR